MWSSTKTKLLHQPNSQVENLNISSVWMQKRNWYVLVSIFGKKDFIFDGFLWFRIDFQKCKQRFRNFENSRNCWILTKSDKLQKNFFNENALELHIVHPRNWTNQKSNVTSIRDDLLLMSQSIYAIGSATYNLNS